MADKEKGEIVQMDDLNLLPRNGGDLQTIDRQILQNEDALIQDLLGGMKKTLKILWKPFGGNDLFFYDEQLKVITDVLTLHCAKVVYFTNQKPIFGEGLIGRFLFDDTIIIQGVPSTKSSLIMEYRGGRYIFRDEASFALWKHPVGAFEQAIAKMS